MVGRIKFQKRTTEKKLDQMPVVMKKSRKRYLRPNKNKSRNRKDCCMTTMK